MQAYNFLSVDSFDFDKELNILVIDDIQGDIIEPRKNYHRLPDDVTGAYFTGRRESLNIMEEELKDR